MQVHVENDFKNKVGETFIEILGKAKTKSRLFPGFAILIFLILQTLTASVSVSIMLAASVKLPGNIDHFAEYMKYYYSSPGEDLIYHLDEILLFEQMPKFSDVESLFLRHITSPGKRAQWWLKMRAEYKRVLKLTFRYKIRKIFNRHREIKEYLFKITGDHSNTITFDLKTPEGYHAAAKLLRLTGLTLTKDSTGSTEKYRLVDDYSPPSFVVYDYYKVLGFNTWTLENSLNKTHCLDLKVSECEVGIPRDLSFFREITGLEINAASFTDILIKERRLQIFLGLLYRLSDREFNYINNLEPGFNAWKKIYNNDTLLCGMFVLSHALRVKDNRLRLPGGEAAVRFWGTLAGADPIQNPSQFLEKLAVKDGGKLNYLYVFSFFLPEEKQKAIFFNFNPQRFREIYNLLHLNKKEKISGLKLPGLRDFGFFTLIYAFKTRNEKIDFPQGIKAWTKAIGAEENNLLGLLKQLARVSKSENNIKRFISVYSKFYRRPELLTEKVIHTLYNNYPEYNVLVDFIEKIPVKKPGTVLKLFFWVKTVDRAGISEKEKSTLIAIFQSLLELLSNSAKYDPDFFEYDQLIEELIRIPLDGAEAYDAIFQFFEDHLDIDLTPSEVDQSFADFLVTGIQPSEVIIHNQSYILDSSSVLKEKISRVLESQEACAPSHLAKINRLLKYFRKCSNGCKETGKRLIEAFDQLPHPEIGEDIPFHLKNQVEAYSSAGLYKNLARLTAKKRNNAPQKEIDSLIRKIKSTCLLQQLKHYLVTCVYALAVKSSKPRIFLNPNLIRLHDFSRHQGKGPWNHSGISRHLGSVFAYHLEGGLSRLNITLAFPFSESMFGQKIGYNQSRTASIIFNNFDLFPDPQIHRAQEYTGLLVKFGNELLKKSRENPGLCQELKDEVAMITAGYHYRKIIDKLNGKSKNFRLFFNEILRLGERLFKKKKFTLGGEFSQKKQLEAFREPSMYQAVQEEMNRLGSIYYHTFDTLKPHRYSLFPQPLSHLFESRWVGGEMIDEFKIKTAYISYMRHFPPQLLGHLMVRYLFYASRTLSQEYKNDYHKTYYLYDTYNYLYLNRIYKELRKKGILRIK